MVDFRYRSNPISTRMNASNTNHNGKFLFVNIMLSRVVDIYQSEMKRMERGLHLSQAGSLEKERVGGPLPTLRWHGFVIPDNTNNKSSYPNTHSTVTNYAYIYLS